MNKQSLDQQNKRRDRLAILANIISPHGVPIYRYLAERFDVLVLISGNESNRSMWSKPNHQYPGLNVKKSWGLTLSFREFARGSIYDNRYLHLNPGLFYDLLRFQPDAIITGEMGFRSLAALMYATVFKRPVWVWWGGTLHTERSVGLFKRVMRKLFALWVRKWISYGQSSTEYLLKLGVPKQRVLEIQNCVDEGLYSVPTVPALTVEIRPALLYVGQMIGRKGVRLLLEAAKRTQDRGYRFSLILVGEGPEKERLRALASNLGLQNVYFYPAQPPEKMPAIYQSADCLVFPTLEDVWGLVVNEALWAGLPVISSIYAGCTQEIVPPENRFDPLDPLDFDRALQAALEGRVKPPDTSRLLPYKAVAAMITEDIRNTLGRYR